MLLQRLTAGETPRTLALGLDPEGGIAIDLGGA